AGATAGSGSGTTPSAASPTQSVSAPARAFQSATLPPVSSWASAPAAPKRAPMTTLTAVSPARKASARPQASGADRVVVPTYPTTPGTRANVVGVRVESSPRKNASTTAHVETWAKTAVNCPGSGTPGLLCRNRIALAQRFVQQLPQPVRVQPALRSQPA